jgi:hypothetical protein
LAGGLVGDTCSLSRGLDVGSMAGSVPNAEHQGLIRRRDLINGPSCWVSFDQENLGADSGEVLVVMRAVRSGRETDSRDSRKRPRHLAWRHGQVV